MSRGRAQRRAASESPRGAVQDTSARVTGDLRVVVGLFVLALLVRLIYLYQSAANPTFYAPIVDADTYHNLAQSLVAGKPLTKEWFWQPFFYPMYLALVYAVSGSSILFAKIVQAGLGALTCVLTYRLGARIFDRRTGVVAGIVVAFYAPLIFLEGELLAEGWAALWGVVLLLLLLRAQATLGMGACGALGVCGALSVLTRPTFLPPFVAACVWLLVVAWRRGGGKRAGQVAGVVAAGFACVALPVASLSSRASGRFTILPASGGINFYIGNNPHYDELVTVQPGDEWERLTLLPEQDGRTAFWDKADWFYAQTRDYAATQPGAFVAGLAHKALQFVNSREIPRNVNVYLFAQWSGLIRLLVWKLGGFGFPFGVVLPLAVVGLIWRARRVPAPVWLFLTLYPLAVVLVFVTGRYRVPLVPVVVLLAAAGALALVDLVARRRWGQSALAGGVLGGCVLLGTVPGPFVEERLDFKPAMYRCVGDVRAMTGDVDAALAAYDRALEIQPGYALALNNRGALLLDRGRTDEAVESFLAAVRVQPDYARAQANLGFAHLAQGRLEEADTYLSQALRLDPRALRASEMYAARARILAQRGRLDEAAAQLQAALQLKPGQVELRAALAALLIQQGRIEEAIGEYEMLVSVQPQDAGLREDLGLLLCRQGRLAQGAAQYRMALALDARRASARLKLGLALEQQGDLAAAIAEYREVLRLDPENAGARAALEAARQRTGGVSP